MLRASTIEPGEPLFDIDVQQSTAGVTARDRLAKPKMSPTVANG